MTNKKKDLGKDMKSKICKVCKEKFRPERQMQTCCSYKCSIEYAKELTKKKEKKKKQVRRKAIKQFNDSDVAALKRKAQKVCNEYIRLRDAKEPCISCLYVGSGRQWHAGHYRPQGGNSLLRYDERNIHKQCSICNNHKSGNLVAYRENLIKKIGLETVEELESMNTVKKWSKDELQAIIYQYKFKIKELRERNNAVN